MHRVGVFAVFLFNCLVMTFVLTVGDAQATVYYVDQNNPAASDANPGTEVAPWLSLNPASRVKLLPGDMVQVKEGIYRVSAEEDSDQVMINPHDSGEAGKPIRFKSSPAYAATLEGDSNTLTLIQIMNQSHIAIEGFRIVNPGINGILIKGDINKPVEDIAIRNNLFILEQEVDNADFEDGIRVEYANNTVIDNNNMTNTNKSRPSLSTGIHLANVTNPLVEYNEIENLSNGLRIRNNAVNTKVGKNIFSNTSQSIQVSGEANSVIRELTIANNVFTSAEVAISLSPDGGIIRKTFVSNNIFNDYSVAAMQIVQPGMGKIKIWNNIFKRGEQGKTFIADVFTYDDPPLSIAKMDYNLFAEQPQFITGLYSTNRRMPGLDVWREFAEQDAHSVVSSIEFENPMQNDFRLAKQSRNVIKGTVDGKPSSRRVEVGAYTTAIKQIGVTRPKITEQPVKKLASSSAVDLTQKSADIHKKSEVSKPVPIEMSKLEWEVDRRLQFGGKCVLESNKVDFFDGYDNTGLKFRVLDNELILLTKSNIDMSFNDVGLQVGSNEFLHADNVVLDQNVVITKEMPRLLTQLRKTGKTRVQLRFWPSYPATRAYSEVVALDGFLTAYQAYKDCQGGN